MVALESLKLFVVVAGVLTGLIVFFAFSRRLKSSSRAKSSLTILMAVVSGLVALLSLLISLLKW
jgi:hypothetical protein